jgi:hypothetical protein
MVLRCFERIGFYQKKGFVEKEVLYMVASGRIAVMWDSLQPVVEIHRRMIGDKVWKNFEELNYATRAFMKEQGLDTTELVERLHGRRGA